MYNPLIRHYFFGRGGPALGGDFRFLDSNDANALKRIILPNTKNAAEGYTPGKRSRVMPLYSGTSNWKAGKKTGLPDDKQMWPSGMLEHLDLLPRSDEGVTVTQRLSPEWYLKAWSF